MVGLVRDKAGTDERVKKELGGRSNIHIVSADLTKHSSLKEAAVETAKIVGDSGIDYLVANGALVPKLDAYCPIGAL